LIGIGLALDWYWIGIGLELDWNWIGIGLEFSLQRYITSKKRTGTVRSTFCPSTVILVGNCTRSFVRSDHDGW
jgi:hypothetical protein